eukprot:gene13284-biopygen5703
MKSRELDFDGSGGGASFCDFSLYLVLTEVVAAAAAAPAAPAAAIVAEARRVEEAQQRVRAAERDEQQRRVRDAVRLRRTRSGVREGSGQSKGEGAPPPAAARAARADAPDGGSPPVEPGAEASHGAPPREVRPVCCTATL